MDELNRKQFNKDWVSMVASCSSHDDARKWKIPVYNRPEGNGHSQGLAGGMSEVRPTKIRRKMIDLCLPADEYIDETVEVKDRGTSSNGLVDLNEPYKAQETNLFAYGQSRNGEFQGYNRDYGKSMNFGSVKRTYIDLEADTDTNSGYKVTHESVSASHQPQRHLYLFNRPDSSVPWSHLHSSSQNPSFGLQRFPNDNAQRQGCFGDRLQHNMFYNECSSSLNSKFFGTGYNYSLGTPLMNPNGAEKKVVRDFNLNMTLPDTFAVEEHLPTLPWLTKPNSEMTDVKLNTKTTDVASSSSLRPLEIKDNDEGKKVPMMLDMNEPYDEDQEMEEQIETKVRFQFDLNVTAIEDETETRSVPISSRLNSKAKIIDLEALPLPESDDEEETLAVETLVAISSARELEEVVDSENRILHWFAETAVNLEEKIDTFAANHVEERDNLEFMTLQLPEMTEDEYMPKPLVPENLNLEETSGTGLVTTSQRPRRGNARKGKQPRRDFQRDVLPGTVTLSKPEVAEDVEMFEGLMRATGRSWTPVGLGKKKTGLRGRPRRVKAVAEPVSSVQQEDEVKMSLEDRSFGDWGQMTRRPRRRQRCSSTSTPHEPVT